LSQPKQEKSTYLSDWSTQEPATVHTGGENVKGDLTTDGVGQAEMGEFLLEDLDELGSDLVFLEDEQHCVSNRNTESVGRNVRGRISRRRFALRCCKRSDIRK
jgi:hypothetical protein